MPPKNPQGDHRYGRDPGEDVVVMPEETPGGARVAPMDKLEEPRNHLVFLLETQEPKDKQLGQLIQQIHGGRQNEDAPGGAMSPPF